MKRLALLLVLVSTVAMVRGALADPAGGSSDRGKSTNDHREGSPSGERDEGSLDDDGCNKSSAPLKLSIDRKSVNIDEGRIFAKMEGPVCKIVMRIKRKDATLTEKSFDYAGPELEVRWPPIAREDIEQIEVRITAKDRAYQAVVITPWSVKIDHEEIKFDTNKAIIRESEVPLLKDSLDKIRDVLRTVEGKGLGPITLFIAGHTDTRGSDEHNLKLSRDRAESIAAWFQKQGLCVPIAYEGFGETALKKLTKDEVDEPANRRVDYILAVEPPVIKKGANPVWKLMSKGCAAATP